VAKFADLKRFIVEHFRWCDGVQRSWELDLNNLTLQVLTLCKYVRVAVPCSLLCAALCCACVLRRTVLCRARLYMMTSCLHTHTQTDARARVVELRES
jgi:hypothetical protein